MNWQFLDVFKNPEYTVTRAIGDWGDVCSAGTNSDGPMGFQFLSKGSVKVLDRDGEFYKIYNAGEQLTAPADAPPWGKQCVILLSMNRTDYFCIRSTPFPTEQLSGTILTLSAGETFTSNDDNFLIAYGILENVEDILYHRSVRLHDSYTYEVKEDAMIVVFQ